MLGLSGQPGNSDISIEIFYIGPDDTIVWSPSREDNFAVNHLVVTVLVGLETLPERVGLVIYSMSQSMNPPSFISFRIQWTRFLVLAGSFHGMLIS